MAEHQFDGRDMADGVTDLLAALSRYGVQLIGCTDAEIAAVEEHFGRPLPAAYRAFLRIAGKWAGRLFVGTDIFYPRVLALQAEAQELLADSLLPGLLPSDAMVFCMHQGYELDYFLPCSDDPPVYQFVEGEPSVSQPWRSFSEFLSTAVESHFPHWKNGR